MDWMGNRCMIVTVASAVLTDFCTARIFCCVADVDARRVVFVGLNMPLRIEDSFPMWPPGSQGPGPSQGTGRPRATARRSQSSSRAPCLGYLAASQRVRTRPPMAAPWAFVCCFAVVARALTRPLVVAPLVVVRLRACLLAVACLVRARPAAVPQAAACACACLLATAPRVRVCLVLYPGCQQFGLSGDGFLGFASGFDASGTPGQGRCSACGKWRSLSSLRVNVRQCTRIQLLSHQLVSRGFRSLMWGL